MLFLKLKCAKFDFGWGSAPDPAGGAYSAPPDSMEGEGKWVDVAWPDLSLRDATAVASGPIWS